MTPTRRPPWLRPRRGLFVEGPAEGGDRSGCRDHVQDGAPQPRAERRWLGYTMVYRMPPGFFSDGAL